MINWKSTKEDTELILAIVDRADRLGLVRRYQTSMDYVMDITATHLNSCPLRLADLLAADDFNFIHDVAGIHRHIDRTNGQLNDCFRPRFAV